MRTRMILAVLALATLGCRTSMNKRPDASPGPDAGLADATVDLMTLRDQGLPDHTDPGPPDTSSTAGVPKAFRVVNRTNRTVYVKSQYALGCQVDDGSGAKACSYFPYCSILCTQVRDKQTCCVECEQDLTLYSIPAGQSRSIPWDGTFFVKQASLCTECQCDQPRVASSGTFEVSARIYTAYTCMNSGCQTLSDGTVNLVLPSGPSSEAKATFSIPSSEAEIVLYADLSERDAASPDLPATTSPADAKPAQDVAVDRVGSDSARDLGAEVSKTLLSEVAGRSFQIAASEALPDAGMYGRSCATSNPGGVYRLTFSDDGTKVTVVRTDPVQETDLTGTLKTTSSTTLNYDLTPAFAGASLLVWRNGGNLIGELAMLGSGAPIIWCIESPMRPM